MSNDDKFDLPPPQAYRGPSGIASKSPWLSGAELPDGQVIPVTIEAVNLRNMRLSQDADLEQVLSLKFVGKKKEMRVNATNRKILDAMFGPDTSQWFGKSVGITQTDVNFGGQEFKGIKIKQLPAGMTVPVATSKPDADFDRTPF